MKKHLNKLKLLCDQYPKKYIFSNLKEYEALNEKV